MESYVVKFKPDADDQAIEQAKKDIQGKGGKIGHEYGLTMKGFSAQFPKDHVEVLGNHPHVDSVSPDTQFKTQ